MARPTLTLRLDPRRAEVRRLEVQLAPRGQAQPTSVFERLLDLWTIPEYVAWINGDDENFRLTDDVAHWAEI